MKTTIKILLGLGLMIAGGLLVAGQPQAGNKLDVDTCKAIAGKTYQAYSSGKFDDFPDAASAMLLKVDGAGKGKARVFSGYDPKTTAALQQELSTTCGTLPAGKSYLKFTVGNGVDAGTAYIWSYNNGERVWAESSMPSRPMKGWMLQVPAAPVGRK